jgi:hypothetical protein
MSGIRIATGAELELDGDLLTVIEGLYREVTLKTELQASYEEMLRVIKDLVSQLSEEDRIHYLVESLFLNSVTYENERAEAYLRKLGAAAPKKARARSARR